MSAAKAGELVFSQQLRIFLGVIAIVFALIGIIGNVVSMVTLLHSRTLRTKPATVLVLSLCASDLLFCLIDLPVFAAHFLLGSWPLGDRACALFVFSYFSTVSVSLTSIAAITVNRYVRIVHTYDAYCSLYTRGGLCAMLALVWTCNPLLMLLPLTGAWGGLGFDPNTGLCSVLTDSAGSAGPRTFLLLAGTVPCCSLIGFCYYKIYRTVRRSKLTLQAFRRHQSDIGETHTCSPPLPVTEKASPPLGEKKPPVCRSTGTGSSRLTRTIFLIIVCFALCFAPHLLISFIDPDVGRWPVLHVLTYVPIWFSSIVNPAIYAASNAQYRRAFVHLVRTLLSRQSDPPVLALVGQQGPRRTKIDR